MKILHVISYFTPKRGGDVNVCYNISKFLARRGHDVTIITTDLEFDPSYVRSIEKEGVKVIAFSCVASCGLFLVTPSMGWWLKKNIHTYDVVHTHNFRSYQNNLVRYFAKKFNINYILQAHGSVLPIFQKQKLKQIYDLAWGTRILRDASNVIALTREEANQYRKMGVKEDKIKIVPNGIDLSEYEDLPERETFKKKYKIEAVDKLILYLGRLHRIKGIDLLVDSFSDLEKEHQDIKLLIVGPDEGHLPTIKDQIEYLRIGHKILFTGPLYGYEKMSAYVDADVYVLPSIYETFPISVLESWACGTPVIVTDRCGIADVIDNRAGLVVPYDKDQLRDAILHMLSGDKHMQDFSRNGKSLVRERFNWEIIAEQVERIYLNCISTKD
jgi:glycosyltransferase involved in cell wall biosynthesis